MKTPFIRTPYNYDTLAASDESAIQCLDESLAKQSFQEECDINTIVRRFGLTGEMPSNVRMPTYGDFTGISNYQDALNAILEAEDSFMAMPAEIRARFQNDPAQFVEFCSDEANREEAVKMGLVADKAIQQAQNLSQPPPSPPAGE